MGMTIEEAIKELKEDIDLYIPTNGTIKEVDRELPDGRLITALEMAINALEKQATCEDAISRHTVFTMIFDNKSYFKHNLAPGFFADKIMDLPPVTPQPNMLADEQYARGYNDAKREIALSGEYERAYERGKADAQPKIGRWIESKGYDDRDHFYTCSECGRSINLICGATLADYPYCHCGAKMQEVE
jgi:hypothetical protein